MGQVGTPAPTPSRANYGFALYLGSRSAFVIYLLWAFFPDWEPFRSYFPQRYWVIAVPVHALTTLALFAFFFYPSVNLLLTPPPTDPRVLSDSASLPPTPIQPHGVPKPCDLSMSHVSRRLYLAPQTGDNCIDS